MIGRAARWKDIGRLHTATQGVWHAPGWYAAEYQMLLVCQTAGEQ
jgi:hypothetical protein